MTVEEKLKLLGFTKSHEIVHRPARDPSGEAGLYFRQLPMYAPSEEASIYAWAAKQPQADDLEILYIGKAGRGITRRCAQHEAGFRNSRTGRKNAAGLRAVLERGGEVSVHVRISQTLSLFGVTVSLYSTEEEAAQALFRPRLNRATLPPVTAATGQGAESDT